MADRARRGQLMPDKLTGGTFTVTNLGAYDIDTFTPILNYPETGILGVGRIVEKPAVYKGNIQIRSMLSLSLTFNHQVIDGAQAAEFLKKVKKYIEKPYGILLTSW